MPVHLFGSREGFHKHAKAPVVSCRELRYCAGGNSKRCHFPYHGIHHRGTCSTSSLCVDSPMFKCRYPQAVDKAVDQAVASCVASHVAAHVERHVAEAVPGAVRQAVAGVMREVGPAGGWAADSGVLHQGDALPCCLGGTGCAVIANTRARVRDRGRGRGRAVEGLGIWRKFRGDGRWRGSCGWCGRSGAWSRVSHLHPTAVRDGLSTPHVALLTRASHEYLLTGALPSCHPLCGNFAQAVVFNVVNDGPQVVDRRLDPLRGELLSAVERVAREAAAAQAAARSLEARLGEAAAAGSAGRGLAREVLDGHWQSGMEAGGGANGRVEELGRRVEAMEERLMVVGERGGGGAAGMGPGAAAGAAALRDRVEVLGRQQVVGGSVNGCVQWGRCLWRAYKLMLC